MTYTKVLIRNKEYPLTNFTDLQEIRNVTSDELFIEIVNHFFPRSTQGDNTQMKYKIGDRVRVNDSYDGTVEGVITDIDGFKAEKYPYTVSFPSGGSNIYAESYEHAKGLSFADYILESVSSENNLRCLVFDCISTGINLNKESTTLKELNEIIDNFVERFKNETD